MVDDVLGLAPALWASDVRLNCGDDVSSLVSWACNVRLRAWAVSFKAR